jgi:AcrR family transcriptional regulator
MTSSLNSKIRRERERVDLREKILNSARDLFVQQGVNSVTMRAISNAIEYTPATLYNYFADKEAILRALCHQDFELFTKHQSTAVQDVPDPVERIKVLGKSYIDFAVKHPNHFRLIFMTPQDCAPNEEMLSKKGEPHQDGYAFLLFCINDAIKNHRLREGQIKNPQLIAQTLWAAVHGVSTLEITMKDDPWFDWASLESRTTHIIDTLAHSIFTDASSTANQ